MVSIALKDQVDRLSIEERRSLLEYLEFTVESDDGDVDALKPTPELIAEIEQRDSDLKNGIVEPLTADDVIQQARLRIDDFRS